MLNTINFAKNICKQEIDMGFAQLKQKAHDLFEEAGFLAHIQNEQDYESALVLMDELIEDYDYNRHLIELLSHNIEAWENESDVFKAFNADIASLDTGVALLKLLMDQHHLGVADLPEIGSKSLVSKIMNGKRRLTVDHIQALSERFAIDPALFL